MLDLSRLNDHSRQFATRLYRLWPQWYQFSRYDPYEEFEKEALLVEVPRPVDGSSHGLFVTTSEWEISVGFGENFHTRFGHNGEGQPGDFYSEALAFAKFCGGTCGHRGGLPSRRVAGSMVSGFGHRESGRSQSRSGREGDNQVMAGAL